MSVLTEAPVLEEQSRRSFAADPRGTTQHHLVRVRDTRLLASAYLAATSGVLIVANGLFLVAVRAPPILSDPKVPDGWLVGLGAWGAFLGFCIAALAFTLWPPRDEHHSGGLALIALAVVSLSAGGGFLVGTLLAAAAGAVAMSVPNGPCYLLVPADRGPCRSCDALILRDLPSCPRCGFTPDPDSTDDPAS